MAGGEGKKLALLVAQELYASGSGLSSLDTPVRGLLLLEDILSDIGFEVHTIGARARREPIGIGELLAEFEAFAAAARDEPDANIFFYFAGHAAADASDLYLLSETSVLTRERFRAGALELSRVVRRLDRNDRGRLFVAVDACRDHVDPPAVERSGRGLEDSFLGLAELRALRPRRGLLCFSASDGETVPDDAGQGLSLFVTCLAEALRIPRLSALEVFGRTVDTVQTRSGDRQAASLHAVGGLVDFVFRAAQAQASADHRGSLVALPATLPVASPAWRTHEGSLVLVAPAGFDPYLPQRRIVRLSPRQASGWSLNPLSAITPASPNPIDMVQTFAEILLARLPCAAPMAVEREARALLAATLLMLTRFADPTLRDMARLGDVWTYLCRKQAHDGSGGFFGDPVMAVALMADRLEAVKATSGFEHSTFVTFLKRERPGAERQQVAACAMAPLYPFQFGPLAQSVSPGTVAPGETLRDPRLLIMIEADAGAPDPERAAVGLWLAAIRMAAAAPADRPPLMIALPDPAAVGPLEFQAGAADLL